MPRTAQAVVDNNSDNCAVNDGLLTRKCLLLDLLLHCLLFGSCAFQHRYFDFHIRLFIIICGTYCLLAVNTRDLLHAVLPLANSEQSPASFNTLSKGAFNADPFFPYEHFITFATFEETKGAHAQSTSSFGIATAHALFVSV